MIVVDLKNFFRDRIWFGWWYRGWIDEEDFFQFGGWCRDPKKEYRWKIKQIHPEFNDYG